MWDFFLYSIFHYINMILIINNKILEKIIHIAEPLKLIGIHFFLNVTEENWFKPSNLL